MSVPLPARIASIDALRGFSMIWILGADAMAVSLRQMFANAGPLLANLGEMVAHQLEHAPWEGLRFYDLLFPLFIFVSGASIVFSLTRVVQEQGLAAAHWRVLRRSALLYTLGVIYYGGLSNPWPDVRLLGVLQRIALCYFFASILFLHLRVTGLLVISAVLLVAYWLVLTFAPVPGLGAGSFEKEANLAWWIDLHYLPGRLWETNFDPEGLLSTVPAVVTCLIGVFCGLLLKNNDRGRATTSLTLIGGGALAVAAGLVWSLHFPIIKGLWTSSFVLVTGGLSAMLLGTFHQIMDVWDKKGWASVLLWIGASAIVLYLINGIVGFEQLASRLAGGDLSAWLDRTLGQETGRFARQAAGLGLAVLLARFLYQRRILLRI